MKKELFNIWFNSVGKDISEDTFPQGLNFKDKEISKDVRARAKIIFNSMYDLFSMANNEIFSLIDDILIERLCELNDWISDDKAELAVLTKKREKLSKTMKRLYDSKNEGKIDEFCFKESKEYLGDAFDEIKKRMVDLGDELAAFKRAALWLKRGLS